MLSYLAELLFYAHKNIAGRHLTLCNMMTLCAKQMLQKMAKKRKLLQDKSAELDQIAKRVCDTAANNLNAFEAYMSDKSVTISNKKDEQIPFSDATESNFAKEVKEWFLEMQNT